MKKYPKNLADVVILTDTIGHLYKRADTLETRVENLKKRMAEVDEEDEWTKQEIEEAEAKMNAYIRLAEKLAK